MERENGKAESDDEALRRGGEAGLALGEALREVCVGRGEIAIRAAMAALALLMERENGQAEPDV